MSPCTVAPKQPTQRRPRVNADADDERRFALLGQLRIQAGQPGQQFAPRTPRQGRRGFLNMGRAEEGHDAVAENLLT